MTTGQVRTRTPNNTVAHSLTLSVNDGLSLTGSATRAADEQLILWSRGVGHLDGELFVATEISLGHFDDVEWLDARLDCA